MNPSKELTLQSSIRVPDEYINKQNIVVHPNINKSTTVLFIGGGMLLQPASPGSHPYDAAT